MSSLALHDSSGTVRKTSLDDAAMSTSGISTLDTSSDATHSKEEVSPNSDGGSSHSPPKASMEAGRVTIEAGSEETGSSGGYLVEGQDVEDGASTTKNTPVGSVSEQNSEESGSSAEDSKEQSEEQNNSCESSADSVVKDMETESPDLNLGKGTTTDDSREHSLEDLKDTSQESSSGSSNQNTEAKESIPVVETETSDDTTQQAASQETARDNTHSTSNTQAERVKQRHISSSGSSSSDEDKLAETLTITETPEISGTGGHLTSEGDESLESSPEPHVCPPPHYLTSTNGMLLP
ncbi:hypothetical protein E2C01_079913 [Portunus trituberculatus]|uniref:Uncharacterized protein n=1 Tax=Portunus trituberculatus TaxID=210409 RepID=A0A5B7II45_PORTR|nr:hypothetical protein [Portunus trituberculatus]